MNICKTKTYQSTAHWSRLLLTCEIWSVSHSEFCSCKQVESRPSLFVERMQTTSVKSHESFDCASVSMRLVVEFGFFETIGRRLSRMRCYDRRSGSRRTSNSAANLKRYKRNGFVRMLDRSGTCLISKAVSLRRHLIQDRRCRNHGSEIESCLPFSTCT